MRVVLNKRGVVDWSLRWMTTVICVISGFSSQTFAVSFLSFDPRSMALGGAGVASAPSYNATLFNPALLVSNHRRKIFFSVPYVGARLLDRDGFIGAVNDYQSNDAQTTFDQQLQLAKLKYRIGQLVGNDFRALSASAQNWLADLNQLSNKPLRASASYQFSAGQTGQHQGWGAHYRSYHIVGAQIDFSSTDQKQIGQAISILELLADVADQTRHISSVADELNLPELEALVTDAIEQGAVTAELEDYYQLPTVQTFVDQSMAAGELISELSEYFDLAALEAALTDPHTAGVPSLGQYFTYRPNTSLQSSILIQGAYINEKSIGFATSVANEHRLVVGLNVKQIDLTAIDFNAEIGAVDDKDLNNGNYQAHYVKLNADIGVTYQLNQRVTLGLVVKNILPYDFETTNQSTIAYRPLTRIGFLYNGDWFNLVGDVDMTSNDPIGFDPNKKYLSIGAEFTAFPLIDFRLGMRQNLVTGDRLPSVGVGLNLQHINLDVAIAKSDKNDELGVALQFGLRF